MKLGKFESIWCFLKSPVVFTLLIVLQSERCIGGRFGDLISIAFSAHGDNGQTLSDIKTKVDTISKEYKRIFSFGPMAREETTSYRWDETYKTSLPQVFTAEVAGQLNHELKRAIEVIIGISVPNDANRFDVELGLALESATKSQNHHHKTTKGFVLDYSGKNVRPSEITDWGRHARKKLKIDETDHKWSFGIRLACTDFLQANRGQDLSGMTSAFNFIICEETPKKGLAGRKAFHDVGFKFVAVRMELKEINSKLVVTGQTGLPSRTNSNKEVDSLVNFWEAADEFTAKESFPLVMTEAFDDPKVNWDDSPEHIGNFGWWDVEKGPVIGKYLVFKEKAPPKPSNAGISMIGRVSTVSTALLGVVVMVVVGIVI